MLSGSPNAAALRFWLTDFRRLALVVLITGLPSLWALTTATFNILFRAYYFSDPFIIQAGWVSAIAGSVFSFELFRMQATPVFHRRFRILAATAAVIAGILVAVAWALRIGAPAQIVSIATVGRTLVSVCGSAAGILLLIALTRICTGDDETPTGVTPQLALIAKIAIAAAVVNLFFGVVLDISQFNTAQSVLPGILRQPPPLSSLIGYLGRLLLGGFSGLVLPYIVYRSRPAKLGESGTPATEQA